MCSGDIETVEKIRKRKDSLNVAVIVLTLIHINFVYSQIPKIR